MLKVIWFHYFIASSLPAFLYNFTGKRLASVRIFLPQMFRCSLINDHFSFFFTANVSLLCISCSFRWKVYLIWQQGKEEKDLLVPWWLLEMEKGLLVSECWHRMHYLMAPCLDPFSRQVYIKIEGKGALWPLLLWVCQTSNTKNIKFWITLKHP